MIPNPIQQPTMFVELDSSAYELDHNTFVRVQLHHLIDIIS